MSSQINQNLQEISFLVNSQMPTVNKFAIYQSDYKLNFALLKKNSLRDQKSVVYKQQKQLKITGPRNPTPF